MEPSTRELLRDWPSVLSNETGNSDGHRRHLVPDSRIIPPGSPLWMTACGIGWDGRHWFKAIAFGSVERYPWCEACLAEVGLMLAPPAPELYEVAVREWIARDFHRPLGDERGPARDVGADDVRKVRHGIDWGFTGSDVTPPDDPEPCIVCQVRLGGRWQERYVPTPSPVELVKQCLAIVDELRIVPA